ncbi:hypothetical protein TRV_06283 [Trichophyton verrucosum HKI 0517]|uniref:Uncharacterized protein n=1 Tax=Trichophyton verrucosum (strain HKI 0517) TaxID=663202 RepID=D4DGH9_TRIVH|nr:uncharacterized protein TRV_06283 [Trichophyton verrucosum HKI 0517]EFE39048.1 hypothetical protein TRV_06283 [Trichophyton verrucosum HKI 0517]
MLKKQKKQKKRREDEKKKKMKRRWMSYSEDIPEAAAECQCRVLESTATARRQQEVTM